MQNVKQFFKYGTLNIAGMLGISCYILADTFFIANGVGSDGLAALNLAIPIYSFVHGCGLMLGTGGSTKYTIAKSQGEHDRANIIFSTTLAVACLFAVLFMLMGVFYSNSITQLLKAEADLYDMTNTYLKVILLFSPFFISNEMLLSFVRSDGSPALAMTAMISGSVANIILDYIFIYPFKMGIFGAVLATGIAPIISILILSLHKRNGSCGFRFNLCRFHFNTIADTLVLGFPTLVSEVSAGIVMLVFNLLIMNLNGSIGIAAYGIIANIALVSTAIYTGLAQGVQPLVSHAYGTNDHHTIRCYHTLALVSVIVISVILYGMMFLYREPIASLFNSEGDPILQNIAVQGLVLYFTSIPFTGSNIVQSTFLTAAERPIPAHVISLLRGLLLVIPLAYIMAALWELKGIWLTLTATELLTAFIATGLWRKQAI